MLFQSGFVLGFLGLGPVELGVVCVVALLLFGSKLPSAMRGIGGGVRAFRQEIQEVTK